MFVERFLVRKLTGTGGTLVGHTLWTVLGLDGVDVLQLWLVRMHPLEVSPQGVSVG